MLLRLSTGCLPAFIAVMAMTLLCVLFQTLLSCTQSGPSCSQALIMPGFTHSMHVHDSIPNEGESYAPWVQDKCAPSVQLTF